ncbi:MAG: IPT/TIG domain-containing protein, partial [Acidobacteriaceae bacterium]
MQVRFARLSACRLALAVASLIAAVSLTTGCGSIEGPLGNLTAISASSASLRVNQQLQIQSRMDITAVPLTWSVNGIRGGNSEVGTITFNGLYTAPASVPTPNTVTITATANGQPNYPPGTLTLSVLNPIPVLSNVAPTNITEGNPTISVNGSQFVYGAQVLWNGAAVPTTFVSSTELAAAVPAPTPGNYPLLVNNPNPGSANSNNLTVPVGPGQVVLAIQPGQNTDVRVTNSINLAFTITGTANTGVTLQVNGVAAGNALVGTAVSNPDGSITYTAPAVVPAPNNIVALTITSIDNPKVSINQNVSVLNPIPILTSANPMSFNPGPATVVVQGQKFISGAQVLQNGSPVPTT